MPSGPPVTTDPATFSATELLRLYRTKALSPVEATGAVLARIERFEPAVNAFCLVDPERALRGGAGLRGALAAGRAAGPARRRADDDQGSDPDPRLADAARQPRDRAGQAVGGGRAGDRAPARARRGAARQDHDARVRLEGGDRQRAHRHHPQPVGPRPDARRLERRRRGGLRARHGRAPCRHRRRRLDPHPGELHRHLRAQAELRTRAGGAAQPVRHGRPSRPDDPQRRPMPRCC